jgi:homoprotocatechuate degradation regulator HpaR
MSELRSVDQSLPIALLRARENLMRRFRPLIATHDLTEQQWRVLRVLDGAGALSVGEIADGAVLLGPSLSRILTTLEQRGWIERRSHAGDARRSEIELTPVGRGVVADVAPRSEATYREIESELGEDELTALIAALERVANLRSAT